MAIPSLRCTTPRSRNGVTEPNEVFLPANATSSPIELLATARATGAIRQATPAPMAGNLYNGPLKYRLLESVGLRENRPHAHYL